MTKCQGCGALLQNVDENVVGYSPKQDVQYCQRCFRLRNYGDLLSSFEHTADNHQILTAIAEMEALFFWVVDLFDFESSFVENIASYLEGKDIVLLLTKRDLLPDTLSQAKLQKFIEKRLAFYDIKVRGYIVTGQYGIDGRQEILAAIEQLRKGRNVAFFGLANSGKSTVLNALFESGQLTTSIYPGTTLEMSAFAYEDYLIYDTPGYNNVRSVLWNIDTAKLSEVVAGRQISPKVYQFRDKQSLALGGIARIDIMPAEALTVVGYFAERLPLHRGKLENAAELWQKHQGGLLQPVLRDSKMTRKTITINGENFDVVIAGLGWLTVKGIVREINVYIADEILVLTREAMI